MVLAPISKKHLVKIFRCKIQPTVICMITTIDSDRLQTDKKKTVLLCSQFIANNKNGLCIAETKDHSYLLKQAQDMNAKSYFCYVIIKSLLSFIYVFKELPALAI